MNGPTEPEPATGQHGAAPSAHGRTAASGRPRPEAADITDAGVGPAPSRLALGAVTSRDRPFEQILAAAAGAGFDGIGLTIGQCLAALERGLAFDRLPVMIEQAGLRLAELELVRLADDGPVRHVNSLLQELVGILSPDRLHVAAWQGGRKRVLDDFAEVCAAVPCTPVAFEFMAYNAVPGFRLAVELAEETGEPNAAVVLDILHFFRTSSRLDELTADALRRVAVVQLSDVVPRPRGDALEEARHRRTYPGQGTLDSVGFLRALLAAGPLPPLSVEPINDSYELLPLATVADNAMVAASRLLETVTRL